LAESCADVSDSISAKFWKATAEEAENRAANWRALYDGSWKVANEWREKYEELKGSVNEQGL
jgi:uncharacterized NAD(P)/FAD-binding protein YdhS